MKTTGPHKCTLEHYAHGFMWDDCKIERIVCKDGTLGVGVKRDGITYELYVSKAGKVQFWRNGEKVYSVT